MPIHAIMPIHTTIPANSYGICEIYPKNSTMVDGGLTHFIVKLERTEGPVSCAISKLSWVTSHKPDNFDKSIKEVKETDDYELATLVGKYILYRKKKNVWAVVIFDKLHLLGTPKDQYVDLRGREVVGIYKADQLVRTKDSVLFGLGNMDPEWKRLKKIATRNLPRDYANVINTYLNEISTEETYRTNHRIFDNQPPGPLERYAEYFDFLYRFEPRTLFWTTAPIALSKNDFRNKTPLLSALGTYNLRCGDLEKEKKQLNKDVAHPTTSLLMNFGFNPGTERSYYDMMEMKCSALQSTIKNLRNNKKRPSM
ncbi:hypothetical protein NHP190002_13070 [Helicobacter ailurogastricus]|uniref:hypothetical protein n=1 Tax=Helicobacter ailurogastricus TaxID=1578720 RepID=UPI00244D82C9|nr:hypothetical protein [Helicobacter ailurogastricus]GMB90603.1 hypothetical protein NHP190002_13070 [Helicobacter ailurogastricus]